VNSELQDIDSRVAQIRDSVAIDFRNVREKLRDITPDFQAIIVLGRRVSLSDYDIKTFRDYNASAYNVEVRTYDWLVEAALERRR
jgi:hypothetical protein